MGRAADIIIKHQDSVVVDGKKGDGDWEWAKALKDLKKHGNWYDPTGETKDCLSSIVITGHGNAGKAGGFYEAELTKGDSGKIVDLFAMYKCKGDVDLVLNTCMTAKDKKGLKFIEVFAKESGCRVSAWTDWYAILPHGEMWRAEPGDEPKHVATYPKYIKNSTSPAGALQRCRDLALYELYNPGFVQKSFKEAGKQAVEEGRDAVKRVVPWWLRHRIR